MLSSHKHFVQLDDKQYCGERPVCRDKKRRKGIRDGENERKDKRRKGVSAGEKKQKIKKRKGHRIIK